MFLTVSAHPRAAAWLGAAAALLLQGCAENPLSRNDEGVAQGGMACKFRVSTCVPVLKPPVVIEAAGLRTVAVVPGQGRGSDAMATQFESRLSKVRVNDEPYYRVVPANDAKRDGLFEIAATAFSHTDSQLSESRCTKVGKKMDCSTNAMRQIACTLRKGMAGATLRLRKRDGAVLATRQEAASAESKVCQGEGGTLTDPTLLLGQAVDTLTAKLQDLTAMSAELQPIRVMDDAVQIKDAARRQRFTEAVAFFKAGRLDRACPAFEEMIEIERSSVALYFNTAFCVQAKGDWRRANVLYRQADALTTAPSKEVQEGIKETQLSATQAAL